MYSIEKFSRAKMVYSGTKSCRENLRGWNDQLMPRVREARAHFRCQPAGGMIPESGATVCCMDF